MQNEPITDYQSLEDIKARRDAIRKGIEDDNQQIKTLWQSLFQKNDPSTALTPSRKLSTMMSAGAGLFDAAILGWKLYRKFGGRSSSKKHRW